MRPLNPLLLIFLSRAVGGGSLVLFAWFLFFGTPFPVGIVHSDTTALIWNSPLCLVFFIQHSGMIRRGPRERIARRVPAVYHPGLYSVASGLALFALVRLWQPATQFLFHLRGAARWVSGCLAATAIAGFAWGIRSLGTFDPFGALPLKASLRGEAVPPSCLVARGPYRHVRHPLYLFMLVLIWSTPRLTTDQLLFNVLWTSWIVVGTRLEERDLLGEFGQTYREYQLSVPMLLPSPRFFARKRPFNPTT